MASIAIAALYSNIVKVTGSIPAGAQLVEHDPQRVEKLPLTLCLHFPLSLSRSLIKDRKFPCVRSICFHGEQLCVTSQGVAALIIRLTSHVR